MEDAVFLERPNRFVAYVEQSGQREICHVKNTGRCRELLVPGAELRVQRSDNPAKKTEDGLTWILRRRIRLRQSG